MQCHLGATTGNINMTINCRLAGIRFKYLVAKISEMKEIGFQCIALNIIDECHLRTGHIYITCQIEPSRLSVGRALYILS